MPTQLYSEGRIRDAFDAVEDVVRQAPRKPLLSPVDAVRLVRGDVLSYLGAEPRFAVDLRPDVEAIELDDEPERFAGGGDASLVEGSHA